MAQMIQTPMSATQPLCQRRRAADCCLQSESFPSYGSGLDPWPWQGQCTATEVGADCTAEPRPLEWQSTRGPAPASSSARAPRHPSRRVASPPALGRALYVGGPALARSSHTEPLQVVCQF